MNRAAVFILMALWCLAGQAAVSAELREIRIAYVDRLEDPLYADTKGYAVEHRSPLPAAELAIADSAPDRRRDRRETHSASPMEPR